jgi:putative transposase
MRYAQYFNKKRKVIGHLWQGRFYSCILDEKHLYEGVRYIENNPVRANISEKPQDYEWSSAKAHVDKKHDPVLSDDCYLTETIKDWLAYINEKDDDILIKNIRQNTKTGRPCGDEHFTKTIEKIMGRRLTALPTGRPAKRR